MITCVRAPLRLRQVPRATPASRMYAVFVPLRHDPGHAQVDYGEALAVIGGVERKIHFFAKDLPHSDGCLLQAYRSESSEAFCEGHNVSFDLFGE